MNMKTRIKEWRIARAKRIACANCPTKRKLEKMGKDAEQMKWDYEDMIDHWMGKAQNYEARCDALQRVIDSLCRGYDHLTAAVMEMRHGKE